MLRSESVIELQILYQQGKSLKAIARATGYSINTVRKYARDHAEPGYRSRPTRPQKLDGYRPYLTERVKQAQPEWIPASVLYREIQAQGYTGSISLLRAYLQLLKPTLKEKPCIRFETQPGQQMQVDFAHFKYGQETFYAFLAVLGYSRQLYVEFVQNQQLDTLLCCHEHAFAFWQGVPKEIVYDNMRTIVLQRNAYGKGQHRLHPQFLDFAKHYCFVPILCRPYHPQSKGKIERMVAYLRQSFYVPWMSAWRAENKPFSLETLNHQVRFWLENVANVRTHATLHLPLAARFAEEQPCLQALPESYPFARISTQPSAASPIWQQSAAIQHDLSIYDACC